ncbi:hypothetical protein JKP88DRAFT_282212 [Tribonema minus]|uniref:Uncharacterized protein n=1 Tax=Tribonema minus TaxID=303371 RepID=A0A835YNL6_9STRA|nr:hypothetical protein JKP88DRAFT_282212 [Tribonema minus]
MPTPPDIAPPPVGVADPATWWDSAISTLIDAAVAAERSPPPPKLPLTQWEYPAPAVRLLAAAQSRAAVAVLCAQLAVTQSAAKTSGGSGAASAAIATGSASLASGQGCASAPPYSQEGRADSATAASTSSASNATDSAALPPPPAKVRTGSGTVANRSSAEDSAAVLAAACRAMARLAHEDYAQLELAHAGAVPAVIAALARYPSSTELQRDGCGALAALALERDWAPVECDSVGQDCRRMVVVARVEQALVLAVQAHGGDDGVLHCVRDVLTNVLTDSAYSSDLDVADFAKRFGQGGGATAVLQALRRATAAAPPTGTGAAALARNAHVAAATPASAAAAAIPPTAAAAAAAANSASAAAAAARGTATATADDVTAAVDTTAADATAAAAVADTTAAAAAAAAVTAAAAATDPTAAAEAALDCDNANVLRLGCLAVKALWQEDCANKDAPAADVCQQVVQCLNKEPWADAAADKSVRMSSIGAIEALAYTPGDAPCALLAAGAAAALTQALRRCNDSHQHKRKRTVYKYTVTENRETDMDLVRAVCAAACALAEAEPSGVRALTHAGLCTELVRALVAKHTYGDSDTVAGVCQTMQALAAEAAQSLEDAGAGVQLSALAADLKHGDRWFCDEELATQCEATAGVITKTTGRGGRGSV